MQLARSNDLVFQGLKFDVVPSTFEENLDKQSFQCPSDYVQETARLKALEVAARMKKEQVKLNDRIQMDVAHNDLI